VELRQRTHGFSEQDFGVAVHEKVLEFPDRLVAQVPVKPLA
jgi:hypothetical protein